MRNEAAKLSDEHFLPKQSPGILADSNKQGDPYHLTPTHPILSKKGDPPLWKSAEDKSGGTIRILLNKNLSEELGIQWNPSTNTILKINLK